MENRRSAGDFQGSGCKMKHHADRRLVEHCFGNKDTEVSIFILKSILLKRRNFLGSRNGDRQKYLKG